MRDEGGDRDGRGRGGHGGGQGVVCPPPFGELGAVASLTMVPIRLTGDTPMPLSRPTPTFRVSFLVTLAVGDTHSLSDPLHSL